MNADSLDQLLLAGSAVLLLAILAVRVSVHVGLPSLLIYLAMGLTLGESGVGVHFDDARTAHALGFAALVVILTEGARPRVGRRYALLVRGTRPRQRGRGRHRRRWSPSQPTTCSACRGELAVLLGAITSPTDAAAVISRCYDRCRCARRSGALEAESGLNDAPTVLLVVLLSTGQAADHRDAGAGRTWC